MRKMRRPKRRKLNTCKITDSVSATNRPPMIGSKKVEVHQQTERAETGADRERTGVAHDDARGRSVPPEEAETGADQPDGDEAEVERGVKVIDREVAELPVANDGEHSEAKGGRPRR